MSNIAQRRHIIPESNPINNIRMVMIGQQNPRDKSLITKPSLINNMDHYIAIIEELDNGLLEMLELVDFDERGAAVEGTGQVADQGHEGLFTVLPVLRYAEFVKDMQVIWGWVELGLAVIGLAPPVIFESRSHYHLTNLFYQQSNKPIQSTTYTISHVYFTLIVPKNIKNNSLNMAQQKVHTEAFLAHAAPTVSLFIGLQNCLNSVSSQKSIKQSKGDIFAFVQRLGPEGEKFAITALLEALEMSQPKDKTAISIRSTLLTQLIKEYASFDNFFSYFPQILVKVGKQRLAQYTNNLITTLKLPLCTQISIALALYLSDRGQLISVGETELVCKIKQYANSEKSVKLPQKLLDQLLFQININPELSNKLDNESKFLLETAEKVYKNSETRIYNYFRDQWQFFANQTPIIEKPSPIIIKKSDILRDLGPSVAQNVDTLKAIISQIGALNQEDIFECLMMMAEEKVKHESNLDRFAIDLMYASSAANSKKNMKSEDLKKIFTFEPNNKRVPVNWNIDNFLQYSAQNIANIKWQSVLSNLDRENLVFVSDEHFVEIMKIFEKIKKLVKKWSITDSIIFKKWSHPSSQAQFLLRLFSCKDPECLFFNEVQPKKGQNASKDNQFNPLREVWGYQELVTLFFQVSEHKKQKMREVLQNPISKYPDILLKTLSQITPTKGKELAHEIYLKILPQFLDDDVKSLKQMEILWSINKQLLIHSINDLQKATLAKKGQGLDLQKLVQLFQQIEGSLQELVSMTDYSLSLPIALISAKKERINLQRWIGGRIEANQNKFCKQMLNYFENNLLKQLRVATQTDQRQNILEEAELTIQTLNKIFIIILDKLRADFPQSKYNETFKKLHKECCKLIPQLAQGQIYEEAERQCEQEIKKIYKQEITIKQAVQNLKRLKNSNKKQQMEHFANRITFLCIELTYHHSYPEKELMITADLFSALINENLVEKKIYQTFLHVIDEYLKEQNQQFAFAMKVIENIKEKLAHQSWFCEKLIENELVMRKNPELVQQIIKSISPPKVLSVQKERKIREAIRLKNNPPQIFSRHMIIEPEVHHPIEIPQKQQIIQFDIMATLDKSKKIDIPDRQAKLKIINTICNTLSTANVQEKAKQLKKALDSDKTVTLLAYRVLKMISITQNNGIEVFVRLLDCIPKAEKPIINMTYKILRNWFNLLGKSASNDKKFSHFKNLGLWLGRMTIGKGMPVPIYKLNLKEILIQSYLNNNRIVYNVPVVLKILQFIPMYPDIFRPQSPWLRRILCALVQLQQSLKEEVNIKSEIKAFFKSTKMDSEVQSLASGQPSLLVNEKFVTINQLSQKINVSEDLARSCENFEIKNAKMFIVNILDAAILQIVEPVIDRTVKIAKTTTKQIIVKDFAMETNTERVKDCGINLVKELSAPLAQVTCREPLKNSITKKLRDYIKENQQDLKGKFKEEQVESLIQKVLNETLQIGCSIIKQKVAKSAQKSIKEDIEISEALELRTYLKKNGGNYCNDTYINSIPAIVPQQLRPSAGGLTQQEYGIYNQLKKDRSSAILPSSHDPALINLLQLREPLQKFRKFLPNMQVSQQFLNYLHTQLLNQDNNQQQLEYYYQICHEVKEYTDQSICWKLFKDVADLKFNEDHVKIMRKLVRDKYFDDVVLSEVIEQEQKLMDLFEAWTKIGQGQIPQYMNTLEQKLTQIQCNKRIFWYHCLKYIIQRYVSDHNDAQHSYNTTDIEEFVYLVIVYYKYSKENSAVLQQIIESIIEALKKLGDKHMAINIQRPFFKILTNLIQKVCHQKYGNSKETINTFICVLARQINKISPSIRPGFAYAWLQLICNKYIIGNLLQNNSFWDLYYSLLASLLKFMNETITEVRLYSRQSGEAYQNFYQAVLKLIIILVHDFSDFLSAFSLELCLLVDARFIQLKNIINSAFPSKQLDIPLKFEKREDLELFVQKVGYPKHYKLSFDKPKLNYYVNENSNDPAFKEKILQQDDFFLQTLVLYFGWLKQNGLTQNQATKRLTDLICSSKDELRIKLVNYIINLIRYPNHITLFFIDFVTHLVFKQNKDKTLRELMLFYIITRMRGEAPIAWGLIYLVKFVLLKKDLQVLNISQELLDQFF